MTSAQESAYTVKVSDDDEPNGVANILATLLQQNIDKYPDRAAVAKRISRPVTVVSTDTDSSATVVFESDRAVVHNGVVGAPSVTVKATVNQVLNVSQLRMKAGGLWPVGFFTKRGFTVLGDILRHRLVVKGLLTHTLTALRFIALISVEE